MYPLPFIEETLNQLSQDKIYTTHNIQGAYNLVRMGEGEEWETAFRIRYEPFELLVMPFGLTDAPADFQQSNNNTLRPYLDHFCTAYPDDILIYCNNINEHCARIRQLLKALSVVALYLKPEKCEFHCDKMNYPSPVIGSEGVTMDSCKVEAITEWESQPNVTDV